MNLFKTIFDHYYQMERHYYDGINCFVFDALGYLRWYSPADDFDVVKFPNKAISEFLKSDFDIYPSNGKFRLKKYSKNPLEISLSFEVSEESTNAFGSNTRMGNHILAALEDSLHISTQLLNVRVTQADKSQDSKVKVNISFLTGFENSLDSKFIGILKKKIKETLGNCFRINF